MDCIDRILCNILQELKISNCISQGRENRDTKILSITIPETPTVLSGTRSFANGTTEIDFKLGTITDPNGTINTFQGLSAYKREFDIFRSITIEPSQDVVLDVVGNPAWKYLCKSSYSNQFTYLEYTKIRIITNQTTNIQIFACTNPESVVSVFSKTTVTTLDQDVVAGDSTEAQTWDAISTLKNNLNRIRNQIVTITGEAWGTVSNSISTIWGKFNATTGHVHSAGANDAPKVPWANVDKTTSNIAEITTKSHTALSDIGTNTHAQIDTAIGTTLPGLVTTHAALIATHGATGAIVGTNDEQTLKLKTLTTPTIQSFLNANHTHAAAGATGGVVGHTTLSDIGTNTHAQIDTHIAATGTSVHGLGTMSTQAASAVAITGGSVTGITDVTVADGGTGASDAATARTNLGLVAGGAGDIWVEKAGDTMTGNLTVDGAKIIINAPTASQSRQEFQNNGAISTILYRPANTDDLRIYHNVLERDILTIDDATGNITISDDFILTSGDITITGNILVTTTDNKYIELGYGVAGKEENAGRIGYEIFTAGAVDIVGAGTDPGSRNVKIWDNILLPANGTVDGIDVSTLSDAAHMVAAPATAGSAGTAGQIAYDASYFYVCVATNSWKRVAIAAW